LNLPRSGLVQQANGEVFARNRAKLSFASFPITMDHMDSGQTTPEVGYSWEFLRNWALDFLIEYMTQGRPVAHHACAAIDDRRLNASDRSARDAIQFLTDVISEPPGSILDEEYERKYFAECAQTFVRETDPKSIVVECSRILGRMEECTQQDLARPQTNRALRG